MAVTDIGIAVTTAIIQRGVACASAITIASPGIAGLHAIAEVVVFQQRTVYASQIGHPTVEIVWHAVAGTGMSPLRFTVRTQPVAERNIDVKR